MKELFEPATIGKIEIKNRFIRAATWEGMAKEENGEPTEELFRLYRELVEGEVGLIITGFAYVDKRGKANPRMLGIDKDELIPSLKRLTNSVHEINGKIAIQLAHSGSQGRYDTGEPPLAPSAVKERFTGNMPVEMTIDDINHVINCFAEAGLRAKRADFDGVELHAAHGYLLSQFLSPYSNRRKDKYGGPIQNRARIIFEIYEALRHKVGSDYTILIKINVSDFDGVGLEPEDSLWVCKELSNMGIDAIELSGGIPAAGDLFPLRTGIDSPEKEAYFRKEAEVFSSKIDKPIILVGGLRSLEVIEELYKKKVANFFSLSRPLISEPGLIKRWREGDRRPARCISCNQCLVAALKEKRLYCVAFKEA
ncbi:MAG: NADH:flavin oxidoreductase [Nitrospirae bacterium]|nr:MAG: NADH:flavin oxidoreductase [Nitrospirota bacterium]